MKKILLILVIIMSFITSQAQLTNINPDPNGEPWIIGGLRIPTQAELEKIPKLEPANSYLKSSKTVLPDRLDNSELDFFRPVFNQSDGCCSQASGVAYNFTYEINRARGTSAQTAANQFPTHFTYDFLNGGSGENGSWYADGWDIIHANGCPDVATYGGLDAGGPTRWMSGYNNYESGMNNRVKDYFKIEVGTPEGLETLKLWMYDHLEGANTGGLANFAAGAGNLGFNMTDDDIVTAWGLEINHAMTFVGWDDNIEYDYNGDGKITTDIDINNDGTVDMRDWEKGALIMVNSWGTSWGNQGKAYVMYKTLAEERGGILNNEVYVINVKSFQEPQLKMRIKMTHNKRELIKISAGVSSDINASSPEKTIEFPLFHYQGGDNDMQGVNSDPIEISLDASELLSYVEPNTPAKFFIIVNEMNDTYGIKTGKIYDFSIVDNIGTVYTCDDHNVTLNNNTDTMLSIIKSFDFDAPVITTDNLPIAGVNSNYSYSLEAEHGSPEYQWRTIQYYNETNNNNSFPSITSHPVTTDNNDDGYGSQDLDFEFPFYGKKYDEVYLLTDGSIVFKSEFSYIRDETAIENNKVISVFASDLMLYAEDNDAIYYEGDATHATFRWKTSLYNNQDANIDAAVTLYPNGDIEFFYGDNITTGLSWAAGISNGQGSSVILNISGESNPSNQKTKLETTPYPYGMELTPDGIFYGTAPDEVNTWNIDFKVTDNNNISDIKTLVFETRASNDVEQTERLQLKIYPNPVTDIAHFNYQLKNESSVNLQIFNLNGKLVETVLDKEQRAGTYRIIWKNNLPAGMYIYKLKTEKGSQTGKLIIQ